MEYKPLLGSRAIKGILAGDSASKPSIKIKKEVKFVLNSDAHVTPKKKDSSIDLINDYL